LNSPVAKVDYFVYLAFVAGTNAAAAQDALGRIPLDHGIGGILGILSRPGWKIQGLDTEFVGQVLKFASPACLTSETIVIATC
jgi:hypothetical protein